MVKTRTMKKKSGTSVSNAINIDEASDVSLDTDFEYDLSDHPMETDTELEIELSKDDQSENDSDPSEDVALSKDDQSENDSDPSEDVAVESNQPKIELQDDPGIDFDFFPALYLQMKEPWGPPSPRSGPSSPTAGPSVRDYPTPVLRTPAQKPKRDLKLKKPYLKKNSGERETRKRRKISPMEKRLTKEMKNLGVRLAALEKKVLDHFGVCIEGMSTINDNVSKVGEGVERLHKGDV